MDRSVPMDTMTVVTEFSPSCRSFRSPSFDSHPLAILVRPVRPVLI